MSTGMNPQPDPNVIAVNGAAAWDGVQQRLPMVRQIASRIRRRLPNSVELDDLAQAGAMGLMSALSNAAASGRECSESYLRLRIQGAILDSLREYDWASRYMRDRHRRLQQTQNDLRQQFGREPSSEEVAESLDLSLETYFEFAAFSQTPTIIDRGVNREGEEVSMEEFVEDEQTPPVDERIENQEMRRLMLMNAADLGAETCCVLLLYYFAEWTGAQIAQTLKLSEARVSQLRTGALAVLRKRSRAFYEVRQTALRPRGRVSASYRSQREDESSLFHALVGVMEMCEPEAWEHCRRVEAYMRHFAERVGYPKKLTPALLDAAMLHDLGSLCVPGTVLRKPGRLNSDEWRYVQRHVEVGAAVLERLEPLSALSPIVRGHHELYCGGGYPEGLRGEQIPLASRMLTFVDTLDALTSPRAYRPAMTIDRALETMRQMVGRQFDPLLAEEFFKIQPGEWTAIRSFMSGEPSRA